MSIYRITNTKIEELKETTFAAEKVQERQDLQRLIKSDVSILGQDLKVVAEEFSNWADSNRRIDQLIDGDISEATSFVDDQSVRAA